MEYVLNLQETTPSPNTRVCECGALFTHMPAFAVHFQKTRYSTEYVQITEISSREADFGVEDCRILDLISHLVFLPFFLGGSVLHKWAGTEVGGTIFSSNISAISRAI